MGHMHVAGFWRGLGLAMAAFLLGALGQGVITWAATQGPQEELGENSQHASQGLAPAHSILDVMLNPESLGTKVVVIGDGEFKKYKVSVLREPLRLVLDLWGVQKYKVDTKKLPPTKEVARVRIGRHQDRMRLVMDMADTSAPQPPLYSVQLEGSNLVLRVGELAKLSPMNQPEPLQRKRPGFRVCPRRSPGMSAKSSPLRFRSLDPRSSGS